LQFSTSEVTTNKKSSAAYTDSDTKAKTKNISIPF